MSPKVVLVMVQPESWHMAHTLVNFFLILLSSDLECRSVLSVDLAALIPLMALIHRGAMPRKSDTGSISRRLLDR